MRSPVETWIKEHKHAYELVDSLVDLLAPDDIQARLLHPEETKLRSDLAAKLGELIKFADEHFRAEEEILLPALKENLNLNEPKIKDALGCLAREHEQMHAFTDRMREILPSLVAPEPPDPHSTAELLRISYSMQSIIRHHCTKEEREVYPLIEKLPVKVVFEIMNKVGGEDSMNLDHLIKPLGPKPENADDLKGMDGPEN